MDVDSVLMDIHTMEAELYTKAKEDLFQFLYNDNVEGKGFGLN